MELAGNIGSLSDQIEEKIDQLVQNKNDLGVQAYTNSNNAFIRTRNIIKLPTSQQINAASEEQTATVEEITKSSLDLADLAQELQINISGFKL